MKIKNTVNFDVGFSENNEDSLVVVDEQTTEKSLTESHGLIASLKRTN